MPTNLEVGYGMARGKDAAAVGEKAAWQALQAIKKHPLSLVQVFAATHYDPEALLLGVSRVVGPAPLIGASAAGQIRNGVQRRAVVVVALASPYLQVKVGVGRGVSQDWEQAVIETITAPEIAPYFTGSENIMGSLLSREGESAFALLFSPGATRTAGSRSFQILETLERLSQGGLTILGAEAAADCRLKDNYVFSGSQVFHDTILVAVVETGLTFGISLPHRLPAPSRVAPATLARRREVLDLHGQPAAAGSSLILMPAADDQPAASGREALRRALRRGSIVDPALALVFSSAPMSRPSRACLGEEILGMMDLAPQVPMVGFCGFAAPGLAGDGANRRHNEGIGVLALGRDLSPAAQLALENKSLRAALQRRDRSAEIDKPPAPEVIEPMPVRNGGVRLEGGLLQSQRMEAVGRLAGGVVHDFNNMLTAIMGYNEIIMMSSQEEDPTFHYLKGIKKSAERAAALTRQLLAFSRKQLLQPRVINLDEVITDLEAMLRRLIGEDIDLVYLHDPALKPVKADPAQLEQVIMNLVINARDAMPRGGKIIVQTANVALNENFTRHHPGLQPGPYVKVAVIDQGLGLDPETLTHIFDPFFTTKANGKGTGLGLATVYEIIKQSGGHIAVSSQPGGGAVFEIYLPQTEDSLEGSLERGASGVTPQGHETVLVVEDDELLLPLIQEALETYGYHVLTARSAMEAQELAKGHAAPIHLLLTDVVMPHQNGRELANSLRELHPEMKILFMSGYTEDAMAVRGLLDETRPFIQKPFPPLDLVCKVREMMDRPWH